MRTAKTLNRLGGCPGRSESSPGAVILLVLSYRGPFPGGNTLPSWNVMAIHAFNVKFTRTSIFGVSDQVRLKPACSTTETS